MNQNLSEIICIVDRSGSMGSIVDDAIGGFNAFLADQREVPGEATVTLVLFDHEYNAVHDNRPLQDVPPLDRTTYQPRGTTALLDAVGRTIDDVGARLAKTPEPERPSKVIVAILTDGMENASKDYTRDKVAGMIEHQQDVYNWHFFFLAANIDAFAEAQSLNIATANTQSYASSPAGVRDAYVSASRMVRKARTGARGPDGEQST